jgi:hypothetical protein
MITFILSLNVFSSRLLQSHCSGHDLKNFLGHTGKGDETDSKCNVSKYIYSATDSKETITNAHTLLDERGCTPWTNPWLAFQRCRWRFA